MEDFLRIIFWVVIIFFTFRFFKGSEKSIENLTEEEKIDIEIQKMPNPGWIYLIEREGHYKIGLTKFTGKNSDFRERIKKYSQITALPTNRLSVNIVYYQATGDCVSLEKKIINEFSKHYIKTVTGEEWFIANPIYAIMSADYINNNSQLNLNKVENFESEPFNVGKVIDLICTFSCVQKYANYMNEIAREKLSEISLEYHIFIQKHPETLN